MYEDTPISIMVGKTMKSVYDQDGEKLIFVDLDDVTYTFYHDQSCCESVQIEDICGDLDDLLGSPILQAEEVSSEDEPPPDQEYLESYSWTFYLFSTIKGSVTVRWLGTSNGYYSERVDFVVMP